MLAWLFQNAAMAAWIAFGMIMLFCAFISVYCAMHGTPKHEETVTFDQNAGDPHKGYRNSGLR